MNDKELDKLVSAEYRRIAIVFMTISGVLGGLISAVILYIKSM